MTRTVVTVPPDAAVECWVIGPGDAARGAGSAGGDLEVPPGAYLEVRGRRRAAVRLGWLAEAGAPVLSVDVRRSQVDPDDLPALAALPDLALLTLAGTDLGRRDLEVVAGAARLAVLHLEAPGLGPGDLEPLRAAGALRQVRLDVPGVAAAEVLDVLGGRALTTFVLSAPRMSGGQLHEVVRRWSLTSLGAAVDRLDAAVVRDVATLTGLVDLVLDGETVDLTAADVAAAVRALPDLESADLSGRGAFLAPDLLLDGWSARPGLRLNGLRMGPTATKRFVTRWPGG